MTPSLSLTFTPPRIVTNGRFGSSQQMRRALRPRARADDPRRSATRSGGPTIDACGAVRGAEGVVDVALPERAERGGELGLVRRLARLEAQVLEQQHLAGRQCVRLLGDRVADDSRRERHRAVRAVSRSRRATGASESFGSSRPSAGRGASTRRLRLPGRAATRSSGARRRCAGRRRSLPFASGTLKSARSRTTPARNRRKILESGQHGAHALVPSPAPLRVADSHTRWRASTLAPLAASAASAATLRKSHERSGIRRRRTHEVDEAVRVAPLVVVPAEHLHHAAAHHHRVDGREDARRRVLHDVGRHERLVAVLEHAPVRRVVRSLGERRVHRVDVDIGAEHRDEVGDRTRRRRARAATCRRACP